MTETKHIRTEPCLPTIISAGSLNQGCACCFLDVPHLHHLLEVDSALRAAALRRYLCWNNVFNQVVDYPLN